MNKTDKLLTLLIEVVIGTHDYVRTEHWSKQLKEINEEV